MPKNPGKKAKAAKSAPAEPSFDQELQTIWDQKDESPTSRLLDASQLWASDECQEDFFVKVKPFLDKFDSKKGASEAVAEDELIALYDEYVSKSEPALLEEVKELRSAGVLSKVEARALKEMSSAERKRLLFVRILVIAMEAEEDGDDIGSDGDEAADGEGDVGGLDIDEAFIAALTEEECAEKPQPEDGAEESVATTGDLVSWLCGLPTAELREMSEARGLESAGETTTARLPLVQGLLRGMLEAEAGLSEDSEDDGEEDDDDDIEDDEDDDGEDDDEEEEDDDEEEDKDEAGPAAKKSKVSSSGAADKKPGECKQQ